MTKKETFYIKDLIKDYWQKRSHTYDQYPISKTEIREITELKNLFASIFGKTSLNILDVGTGTGFLALLLAEMGHTLTGVDITEEMMQKAKQKAKNSLLNINFKTGDAENLPFENNTFDVVVCRYCLWTLPDPNKAILEWKRVLKPSGKIAAIEGQWSSNSIKGCIKRLSKRMGLLLYEKTNPFQLGYHHGIQQSLPLRNGIPPKKAVEIFKKQELNDIHVESLKEVHRIHCKGLPTLYRLAIYAPTFLITGHNL